MAARAAHSIYFDGTCLAQSPRVLFLRLIFLLLLLCSSRALLPISPPPVCSSPYTPLWSRRPRVDPPACRSSYCQEKWLSAIDDDVVVERFRFVTTRDQSLGRRFESWPNWNFRIRERGEARPRPSARDMNFRTLCNDKSINPARGKNSTSFDEARIAGIKVSRIWRGDPSKPVIELSTARRDRDRGRNENLSHYFPDRNRLIP